ncbi:MAG: hypothetical protein JXA83_10390 [Acidimicrobiales bacterium]|nr:hypothetical protein [Acidimicrobiales bacterium]
MASPSTPAEDPRPRADPAAVAEASERFTARIGVQVEPRSDGCAGNCGATATLDPPTASVPTGAVLALVDAAARAAAETALGVPGTPATLVPTATGVQHRVASAAGALTAQASVPCEGTLADRADERGVLRFSVAVEVVDAAGERIATGTVQWLARITRDGEPPTDDAGPVTDDMRP